MLRLEAKLGIEKSSLSPPFLKTRFVSSNRWRDLQWPWMFSWQWIWGLLPLRAFLDYPLGDLRVDLAKLFLVESPNRIAWHLMPWTIRFTSFVTVCSDGSLAPSLLPPRTSPVVAALPCCWIVIKSCSVCCICFCIFTFLLLCLVFLCCCLCCPLGRVLYYDVCHFCRPCCRVWALLCNQLGFLPTWFGSVPML
jgi:hypothetical protein